MDRKSKSVNPSTLCKEWWVASIVTMKIHVLCKLDIPPPADSNGPNPYLSWSKGKRKKMSLSGLHCIKTRRCSLFSSLWSAALGTEEASLEAAHLSGRHVSTKQGLATTVEVWPCPQKTLLYSVPQPEDLAPPEALRATLLASLETPEPWREVRGVERCRLQDRVS